MVSLKVYNKEDKLKLLIKETSSLKIVDIHKYDGENRDIHSFTYTKDMSPSHVDKVTFYDFLREENGEMVERLYYTNLQKEHWRLVGENEEITNSEIYKSGNKYEKRVKRLDGGEYTINYKNGELLDFKFPIQENKINEYLKILKDE